MDAERGDISSIHLDDGRRVAVRPIRADDASRLIAMHSRLSATTVARRFFIPLPELDADRARFFTHVDGADRAALVAVGDEGELVAVVRYDRLLGSSQAEVAIVVQDGYQHHGIGTALLVALTEVARAHGITALVADVLLDNTAMFHSFRDAGLVGAPGSASYDAGVAHLLLPLPAPPGPERGG